jgi:tetratricopeptide (TPR) repeat protein
LAQGNLGFALLKKGQLDAGIYHLQETLKMQRDSRDRPTEAAIARLHYGLGDAFSTKASWDQAIFHYLKVLQWNRDYPHAELNLGMARFRAGRIDEAIASWQKALATHHDEAKAHANLGDALLTKGLAGDAIAHYEKSLKIAPRAPEALNKLAWALSTCPDAKLRNGSRAIQLAEQADQLTGGRNPLFIRTLGAAYAEGGRFNDAIDATQKALQVAAAQGDSALVSQLRMDIDLYRIDLPRR